MTADKKNDISLKSSLVHGKDHSKKWDFSHHIVPPISCNVAYRMDSLVRGAEAFQNYGSESYFDSKAAYIYDRLDDPVRGMLEENLAQAESGDFCATFASGMAAINAAIGVVVKAGDEILSHNTIYGCTFSVLTTGYPRYNIHTTFTDFSDSEAIKAAITDKTRVLYFETPVNPNLEILDIVAIKAVADKENENRSDEEKIVIIVDNTMASPYCQRPLTLGVDMVVESLTKHIGGFGTDIGGMVVTSKAWQSALYLYRKDFGASLSPKSAWETLTHGLPTLAVRLKAMQESAMTLAKYLEQDKRVKNVSYPGLSSHPSYDIAQRQMLDFDGNFAPGNMLFFEMNFQDPDTQLRMLMKFIADESYTLTFAVSLGMIKTLIEAPGLMTHSAFSPEELSKSGTAAHGIRISVGIEAVEDIIADLDRAFDHVI